MPPLGMAEGFTQSLQPPSCWLDRSEGAVTPEESLALDLLPGSRVYRFQRIRYADGQTMALDATIPGWGLTGLDGVEDALYKALVAAGNRPARALQRVRAEQAAMLAIAEGDPGLIAVYSSSGQYRRIGLATSSLC